MRRRCARGLSVLLLMLVCLAWEQGPAFACHGGAGGQAGSTPKLALDMVSGAIHIGERVYGSLILPAGSTLPQGTLDRRGPCPAFQFQVEPASGWRDPYADWYYSGINHNFQLEFPYQCGLMGGIAGQPPPPPQITFTLNDWVQFDRPGTYRISLRYTTYERTLEQARQDPHDERHLGTWITLRTEPIKVVVLPEPADVSQRTANVRTLLRVKVLGVSAHGNDPYALPEWMAYSTSPEVVPVLAKFYQVNTWVAARGLRTSPDQELVVREMEKQLVSPDFAVSAYFVAQLAFASVRLKHPELFPPDGHYDQWTKQWEQAAATRREAYLATLADYCGRLLNALPRKQASPHRDSQKGLWNVLENEKEPGWQALRRRAQLEFASSWRRLDQPNAWYVTESDWELLRSPAMLPFLRRQTLYGPKEPYTRWLYELSPSDVRRGVVNALSWDAWGMAASWASVFDHRLQPSAMVDEHLRQGLLESPRLRPLPGEHLSILEQTNSEDFHIVLMKAGSAALAPTVRRVLAEQNCMGDPALWEFLLNRVGKAEEAPLLRRYRKASARVTCEAESDFQEAVAHYWSPRIEETVVAQLDGPEPAAIGAARLLARYGSPAAEDALWERLQRYYRSHATLLPVDMTPHFPEQPQIEGELMLAIMNGRLWYPTPATVEGLRKFCVHFCGNVTAYARSADQTQYITVYPGVGPRGDLFQPESVTLLQYDLDDIEAWIARFPKGTRFAPQNYIARSAYAELANFLKQRGMILQDGPVFDSRGRCRLNRNISVRQEYPFNSAAK